MNSRLFHRHDVDGDAHAVVAAADVDALEGTYVAVVAAPGERDVTARRGNPVVGRIDVAPTPASEP